MALLGPSLRDLTNARAADVSIVDANGDPITSFTSTPPPAPGTATITSVASSVTSVLILASNASRRKFIIFNDSTKTLRFALSTSPASPTNTTLVLAAQSAYESSLDDYTGDIQGIWSSAAGNARVTELT